MIPKPLYVSFFTPAYAEEAAGLIETLNAWGLEHDVRPVADSGSWVRNCGHKPTFLWEMRERYPGRPLVWLDADARVMNGLGMEVFERLGAYDFAAHCFKETQLASGTLWFAPTYNGSELIWRWAARCREQPELLDQDALAIEASRFLDLAIFRLPACMCYIFDLSAEQYPGVEPVILHRQASRALR